MRLPLATCLLAVGCGASPGRPIVFAAALDGQSETELYSIQPDGSALTQLTTHADGQDYRFPRWSPDGTQIAYIEGAQLSVIGTDGISGREDIATVGRGGAHVTAPDWSPDGTRLVYSYPRDPFLVGPDDDSYATTLHFVGADGSSDAPFLEPADATDPPGIGTLTEPAWSSTGVLAFREDDDCLDCAGGFVFSLVGDDGSDYHSATINNSAATFPRHDLDWSPDASRWAYTTNSGPAYESPGVIAVVTADGPAGTLITDIGCYMPRWSSDGGQIAFLKIDGIYAMDADGSHQHQVLAATGIRGLDW